ncbi:FAD-binding dehydrogenase [Sphingobacterium kyonggiense]
MKAPRTIIIGSGLSGLVTAYEITKAGKKVIIVDQEGRQNLGGQAYWSFGGLFFVDSVHQRRLRVKDSLALAKQDWAGSANFDRPEDHWPRLWADAYVNFAYQEKYDYVRKLGLKFFPIVGWAERGAGLAFGHGNSVPRFHITWGTGPGVIKPFVDHALEMEIQGLLEFKFRHQVTDIKIEGNQVKSISGNILAEDHKERGMASNREVVDHFLFEADHLVIATGGIGANLEMVKKQWPDRLGNPPNNMVCGVPAYVDGKMLQIAENAGVHIINKDRMWHYTEGLRNWNPIWPNHGIRILPGPSSIWLDALGNRLPAPLYPGFDTLATLKHIQQTGHSYSWFISTQSIIKKEFALSGSEQNPDLTNKDYSLLLKRLFGKEATGPVEDFKKHGVDFITSNSLTELVDKMNKLSGNNLLKFNQIKQTIEERDSQLDNSFCKDFQINYIQNTRRYLGDKIARTAKPHKILDEKHFPLIAVRLNILTRKTLGGIETNLNSQAFNQNSEIIAGLYAVGEAAGFGGGGMHGYNALEGTFLGGCIYTGKQAGQFISKNS